MEINKVLKPGDLVVYHRQYDPIDRFCFELGNVYEVKESSCGSLEILSEGSWKANLVNSKGMMAHFSDHFKLYKRDLNERR